MGLHALIATGSNSTALQNQYHTERVLPLLCAKKGEKRRMGFGLNKI